MIGAGLIASLAAKPAVMAAGGFLKSWWKALAGMVVGLALGYFIGHYFGFHAGKEAEAAAWRQRTAELAVKAAQIQRTADQILARARVIDGQRIATNRQEIDNALRNIPDQGLTDRQRAVFCVRLRRENPAAFQSHPACRPSQPARSPAPAR